MSRKGNRGKAKREAAKNQTPVLHVNVCTPAYDGRVYTYYAQSLAAAAQTCTVNMIECIPSVVGNSAFIEVSRNMFVHRFLTDEDSKHFTHLMFIDADLQFPKEAIAGLVRSGLPICAGMYRRRQEPESYPCRQLEHPEVGGLWVVDNFIAHDRVPTGMLCISREVLQAMYNYEKRYGRVSKFEEHGELPMLFETRDTEEGLFMGEDFAFCEKYMKMYREGIFDQPIWVWPDFDMVHGGYKCNYGEWLQREVAKSEGRRKGQNRGLSVVDSNAPGEEAAKRAIDDDVLGGGDDEA